MKFSTRTTYGLRAMTALARQKGDESVSLASIAKSEHISLAYLERIFARLRKAGLVVSEKGTNGGYRLVRSASEIKALEIVSALEGDITPFRCIGQEGKLLCKSKACSVPQVLVKVQQAVVDTLRGISLADLVS